MESPIEVVRRFCAAWSDNIGAAELAAFFHPTTRLPQYPAGAGHRQGGHREQHRLVSSALARQASRHPVPRHQHRSQWSVVMTERVDVFKLPDKSFELPVMGTFEVSDGKISAWRDYST